MKRATCAAFISVLRPPTCSVGRICFVRHHYCTMPDQDNDKLIRKLKWRSMERGMVENELILKRFHKNFVPNLSFKDLQLYEEFLDEPDPDIFRWLVGNDGVPEKYSSLSDSLMKATNELSAKAAANKNIEE